MSIYGSTWDTDADDHEQDCARWVECDCPDSPVAHSRWMGGNDGRHWRYDGDRPCSCLCGPIIYQGSHVLPSNEDRRGGSLGFGEIAGDITRDGRDDGPEDEDQPWPYLRVTMRADGADDCQDVVLDVEQARSLGEYLLDFARRVDGDFHDEAEEFDDDPDECSGCVDGNAEAEHEFWCAHYEGPPLPPSRPIVDVHLPELAAQQ